MFAAMGFGCLVCCDFLGLLGLFGVCFLVWLLLWVLFGVGFGCFVVDLWVLYGCFLV